MWKGVLRGMVWEEGAEGDGVGKGDGVGDCSEYVLGPKFLGFKL